MAFVTAVHLHPSQRRNLKNLLLTSSTDWTIRLWDSAWDENGNVMKLNSSSSSSAQRKSSISMFASSQKPLLEFAHDAFDYICDIQWSPVNCSLFAAITSGGHLIFWNLNRSSSEPVESINVMPIFTRASASEHSSSSSSLTSNTVEAAMALNRLLWSADGKRVFIGNSKGSVLMLTLKDVFALQRAGDESKLDVLLSHVREKRDAARAALPLSSLSQHSVESDAAPIPVHAEDDVQSSAAHE